MISYADFSQLKRDLNDRWHTRTGLVFAIVFVVLSLILILSNIDLGKITLLGWILLVLVVVVIIVIWVLTRVPRAPRNRIGFGVAIHYEIQKLENEFRSDFIVPLRDLLLSSGASQRFSFIEFPRPISESIVESEQAISYAKQANVRFLLYGRVRERKLGNDDSYIIDMRVVVRHSALQEANQKQFQKDVSSSIPVQWTFKSDVAFFVCEFAAKHVDAAVRFLIGTTAYFSGDFQLAEQLLLESEARLVQNLTQVDGPGSPSAVMLSNVKKQLIGLYEQWMGFELERRPSSISCDEVRHADSLAKKLLERDPTNYSALLSGAYCAFVLRRNVTECKDLIAKCSGVVDGAWKYSDAFLLAYEGDLDGAYRAYSAAFESPLQNPGTPIQCEIFIQEVLDAEPDLSELHFCLGLINFRLKRDYSLARYHFIIFLKATDHAKFASQVKAVQKWMKEVEARIKIEGV